jgi:N-acetylglucosamine kinase-like BadF-type ATPase
VKTFLGVDGGGTKTRFLLIEESGRILASHLEGSAYYLEIGLDNLKSMLARGIRATLQQGGVRAQELTHTFVGIPAYGEDRGVLGALNAAPSDALPQGTYHCGNDMVCGWAGALAGEDGINVVAGTGSIAYGEYAGRTARAGGWGELFSDEGSAYWLAREGLRLFSRMSDGRSPRGPLYERVRAHFALHDDLDLCPAVYGTDTVQRSRLAQLSKVVAEAATDGDPGARELFLQAARELIELIDAVRVKLQLPPAVRLAVSCSGGMFQLRALLLEPLAALLSDPTRNYELRSAALPPHAGAALYAARLVGITLPPRSLDALKAAVDAVV